MFLKYAAQNTDSIGDLPNNTHAHIWKGRSIIFQIQLENCIYGIHLAMPRNELAGTVALTLSAAAASTPHGVRSSFSSNQQQVHWDSVSQRPLKSPDTRQLEFPASIQMAGVQVQIARCLSPLLLIEDCSHAYIIQKESSRVADSLTAIHPCNTSCCALPQHISLTSPQDSENRDRCTCCDPAPNDICWCLHTGHCMRGSNKNYQGSLIL